MILLTKQLSKNALVIYNRLYYNNAKKETTPEQVHERVTIALSNNEEEFETFLNMLNVHIFRPNTPCLINAGKESNKLHDKQLCACFVLGLEDSMDSIIDMWSICAKIYASGAGAGIPMTNLREEYSPIAGGGTASGPIKYMHVVDIESETVRSGGAARRAANMAVFVYNHPDVLRIIEYKSNGTNLKNFNLSMSVPDKFMQEIYEDKKEINVDLISPNKNKFIKTISGIDLWNTVIDNAHNTGDPGLLFIDQVNKYNPFPNTHYISATNPCGEVPLFPWSVCNIGSINLNPLVIKGKYQFNFNWKDFIYYISKSVQFLNNVIDKTTYLHPKFEEMSKKTRPIGLGFMGFADVLLKLGIPYGSDACAAFFEELCFVLNKTAIHTSILMCKNGKKPIEIPEADKDHFYTLLEYYTQDSERILTDFKKYGIANCTWTCLAPTGSISISADCSYSWEPHFAIAWKKSLSDSNEVLNMLLPEFQNDLPQIVIDTKISEQEILEDITNNNGSIQSIDYISQKWKDKYIVAHDVDPIKKIIMQGKGQKWISLAISSTCNLPNKTTKAEISKIYKTAWKNGLKGITVFRDGCKESIVQFGKTKDLNDSKNKIFKKFVRPIKRSGDTIEIPTPYGQMYITCNFDEDKKPFEIFIHLGKQGGLTNTLIDALGRICSKALQNGTSLEMIIDTLRGIKGDKFWFNINDVVEKSTGAESLIDAISLIMEHHWFDNRPLLNKKNNEICYEECPECHRKTLVRDGGCRGGMCSACGYSLCG